MNENIPLSHAPLGRPLEIVSVSGGRGVLSLLTVMGLSIGSEVRLVSMDRRGGPVLIIVGETRLAIGCGIAQKIMVRENKERGSS